MTSPTNNVNNINSTSGSTESATSAHGLQALIELSYVQVANQVLVGNLASLSSAMGVTTNVISLLTTLQNLHNDVSIDNPANFNSKFNIINPNVGSATAFESAYSKAASAFFGQPVKVSANFGAQGGQTQFVSQLSSVYAQLKAELPILSAITPLVNGATDPNSLYANVQTVLSGLTSSTAINSNGTVNVSGAITWIEDHYNTTGGAGAASAGAWQQQITNALTAGQSLNTTQTETLRS